MGTNDFDPNDPRVQLEVMKERLRYADEKSLQQGQDLEKALFNLGRKETELNQVIKENNALQTELTVQKQQIKFLQETLDERNKKAAKKNTVAKVQAFLASLLFLVASVLASFGTNMLTSTPPNSLGWLLITLSIIIYIIATLLTTLLTLEGKNE